MDWAVSVPWWDYVIAVGIFLLFLLFRKVFTRYIFKIILSLSRKTKASLVTQLLLSYEKPLRMLWVIFGTFLALRAIDIEVTQFPVLNNAYQTSLILILFWGLYYYVSTHGTFMKFTQEKLELDKEHILIPFISNILRFVVVILAFVTLLSSWGIEVGTFVAGLGIGGLAFALAAQETLANLFGGVVIITERPFRKGDWIATPSVEGIVEDITFRSTKVRTFADAVVVIPNATISKEPITNWSVMTMREVSYSVGVRQETSREDLQQAVLAIRTLLQEHEGVRKETVMVHFDQFSESSFDIFLYYFTKTTAWTEWADVKEEINFEIMNIFREQGVQVATPSLVYEEKTPVRSQGS
ncbi:mechanosensitive ion channel family protein [Shouchella shacheensis]|uniref:mechanosensitive ion channel family protein n=1 Tax=Shouchella shacheensis TaxID=1649580 RepID=UPI000A6C8C70|nr:mechanosensitive ion channel family protein [Shouchella shacheensis]